MTFDKCFELKAFVCLIEVQYFLSIPLHSVVVVKPSVLRRRLAPLSVDNKKGRSLPLPTHF